MKEQEEWLEEWKPAFLIANQQKNVAKFFFPNIVKEFHEKWPVTSVTQEEISNAGSLELAERIKREWYDKVNAMSSCKKERETNLYWQRTSSWYHNNTRNLLSNSRTQGVLKVKGKPQPKKLQPWQAYHVLTYESHWKPHVDAAWIGMGIWTPRLWSNSWSPNSKRRTMKWRSAARNTGNQRHMKKSAQHQSNQYQPWTLNIKSTFPAQIC